MQSVVAMERFPLISIIFSLISGKNIKLTNKKIMNKIVQTGLLLSMIFLNTNTFCQTTALGSNKIKEDKKTAKTYLDLMINLESTNLNYGNLNNALADYKKPVKGIQAGLSFQAGITSWFSLVPELYFMRKGGELTANNPLSTSESTLHINTLELPVLARFHSGKFYLNAGPSIAYALSGNKKTDDQTTKLSFHNSSDGFKRFDAGIQFGGGVEFPLKQSRIALDIRYNYGLTNITYNEEIYNRALMISVHFSKAWKTNPLARK
jgi:hypothetical protein